MLIFIILYKIKGTFVPCNIRIWSSRQSQDDMPKVKVALACCKYMGNEYALIRLLQTLSKRELFCLKLVLCIKTTLTIRTTESRQL